MKFNSYLGLLVCLAVSTMTTHGAIIANWTFETSVPTTSGPHTAESGAYAASSFASGFHSATTTFSNPVGNGSSESFSANTWSVNDYWQFTTSTVGYNGITISFNATGSSTGPRDFKLAYDVGSGLTDSGTYTLSATSWSSATYQPVSAYSFDLSTIVGLANKSAVTFRLINTSSSAIGGGTVAAGGTSRVDNFVVSGDAITVTPVPEPGTFVAGALLLLPFGLRGVRYFRSRMES